MSDRRSIIVFAVCCSFYSVASAFLCSNHVPPKYLWNSRTSTLLEASLTTKLGKTCVSEPSPQDLLLDRWYKRHGILGTSCLEVLTTEQSVGGRGLFWTSDCEAKKGDVLGCIPARCVLSESTGGKRWPDLHQALKEQANECKQSEEAKQVGTKWPISLTTYARRALWCNGEEEHGGEVEWAKWVDSWAGGGPLSPRAPDSYSDEELASLALDVQSSSDVMLRVIKDRYDLFQRDAPGITLGDKTPNDELIKKECADLYGTILARAANLGPTWNYESCIIPMHDMINHHPPSETASVELFTYGDIRQFLPDDMEVDGEKLSKLDDQDVMLVARRIIQPGEELFLSYKGKAKYPELERVWAMLQYGFPVVSM